MKFTSALSAIALVVFAQTVAASPTLVKNATTDVKHLPSEYLEVITVASLNDEVLWEEIAVAKIVDIVVSKNVTHANVTPDTVTTILTVVSEKYANTFALATSQVALTD